ncbi:MAG: peptidase, partial [Acidobacteria bacterium]|nr:peptidase [Acidobacteriota bacterium]
RLNVATDGPWAKRTFAVLPTDNRSRLAGFLELMDLQGFEVYSVAAPTPVFGVVDQLGRRRSRATLPAGTVLIPNLQPEAHLIATMLEFDVQLPIEYLERERTSILRDGRSTIYDVTAWNVTMLYGLEALALDQGLPSGAERLSPVAEAAAPSQVPDGAQVAWLVDGADDRSVAYAARLLERGVSVRVADRALELGGQEFARGSVVVLPADNRRFDGDLEAILRQSAAELQLALRAVSTGLGEGELPDIGGSHFRRLEPPRIALLARGGISSYDYGSIWHTLDLELGIRHSQLDETALNFADLRRYNVVVLPDRFFGSLEESAIEALTTWVEAGGTLIAIAESAAELATEEAGLSQVRRLRDVIADVEAYELAVLREGMAVREVLPPVDQVWAHVAAAGGAYPWDGLDDLASPTEEERERQDEWDRMFMPQGALLASRTDPEHWLTFGTRAELPLLVNQDTVLMAKQPTEVPVRFGVLEKGTDADARRIGWSVVAGGEDLRLRMSGLLWPEAAARLANSAAVTRERRGNGQVILFANPPTFRASTLGTARLLMNAMIYGPAFGARTPITP